MHVAQFHIEVIIDVSRLNHEFGHEIFENESLLLPPIDVPEPTSH